MRQTIAVLIDDFEQQAVVTPPSGTPVDMTFRLDMAAMDLGVAEGEPVDLSKPFFPFGAQPQPGAAFYFSHAEAFSKPGARLRLYVQPAETPQGELGSGGTAQSHTRQLGVLRRPALGVDARDDRERRQRPRPTCAPAG